MSLFRKRKTGQTTTGSKFILEIRQLVEQKQRRFADYLGRKTQYWNRRSKILAFTLFCLLFGTCCLLLLIKAIVHF